MIQLRPFQSELSNDIDQSWLNGNQNVIAVSATGSGKTVLMGHKMTQYSGVKFAIAHRHELVGQISTTLGKFGIRHRIIGSDKTIKAVVKKHVRELGTSYYDPNSLTVVASVDTLIKRNDISTLFQKCVFWMIDEAHHVLRENKWGTAAALFPNAKGLGVTATPVRGDRKGLGRHADGIFDAMVEGPPMRWLIEQGYLCDYTIFCPGSDIDMSSVNVSRNGDFNQNQMKKAAKKSHIVGDVVDSYIKFAHGKRGITFATDVETATDIATKFNNSGVPAAVIHAGTLDGKREQLMLDFHRGRLWQLVNVDLFGEGLDVPGIEVVSMARPTKSFSLYSQQFGRALRPLEGKDRAIIIDHVNNVIEHGLPDAEREWTLDAAEKQSGGSTAKDAVPLKACPGCSKPYERIYRACPHCGHEIQPVSRSGPEFVDGDLIELDADTLRKMRGEVAKAQRSPEELAKAMQYAGVPAPIANSKAKKQTERLQMIDKLTHATSIWVERHLQAGYDEHMIYRRFYHRFGVDIMTAKTLDQKKMFHLKEEIHVDNAGT